MRTYTITLAATDTPASLYDLIDTSLAGDAGEQAEWRRKFNNLAYILIYAEAGNNNGANGPCRVGKGSGLTKVDRVAADAGATDDDKQNGFPLVPGIYYTDIFPPIGMCSPYNPQFIYFSGETGDVFQIHIVSA